MPVEAAMIWNEPNNKSHWDPAIDSDWSQFARMVTLAGAAIVVEIDDRDSREVTLTVTNGAGHDVPTGRRGFGLVGGAFLAREAARQVRVDFGWLA